VDAWSINLDENLGYVLACLQSEHGSEQKAR